MEQRDALLAIEVRRGLPEEVTFEWWPALREGPSGPRICRKRGPGRGSEGQGTKGGNEPGRLYKQTEGECGWGGVPGEGGRRWVGMQAAALGWGEKGGGDIYSLQLSVVTLSLL